MARGDVSGSKPDSLPEDWESYWRSDWITSFAEQFPDNYDGTIREFWQSQLTGDLTEVVDIGCGNGALAWIADEVLNRPSGTVRITGIDSAVIDPFGSLRRKREDYPNLRFVGQASAEALPFADNSIDLVVSQYGIEYSNMERSVPEIARILRPCGRMAFILHDAESSVVRDATRHLDAYKAVLDLKIHDLALEFHALGARLTAPQQRQASPALRTLAARLNELTDQVREIVRGHAERSAIHKYMDGLMQVFAHPQARNGADAVAEIERVRDAFLAHVRKMSHMRSAALSEQDRRHLTDLIQASGFTVSEMSAIGYRLESNVGTRLVAGAAASASAVI